MRASIALVASALLCLVACGATIRTSTIVNSDGTQDTRYPLDAKPSGTATLTFDATACASALALIANQNTGTPTSINIDTACLTGTLKASSTLTIDASASAANWSISGSYPNRALTHAGSIAGSGTMVLHATASGLSATSDSYSWVYTAASLASPWLQGEVGSPAAGSNATSTGGIMTQVCHGDTNVTADTGHFVYQAVSGDFEMIGPMPTITASTVWALHAPSIRQSPTATGAKYGALFMYGTGRFAFNWRTATNGANGAVSEIAWTSSQYWRLTRVGNVLSGYYGSSSTGPWTLDGSQTVSMSDPVYAGDLCGNGLDANPATIVAALPTINALAGGSPGTVAFSASTQTVNENGSALTVSVQRTGGSTGSGSVVVSRSGSSTATLTTHYTTSCAFPCTVTWTNGETADKTITVTPVNTAAVEASRHLDLALGSASGVSVGSPSTQVITINDVSSGAQTKWHVGGYGDCFNELGAYTVVFIGNSAYTSIKSCIDYWATQTPAITGVFIDMAWSSYEGTTEGCYGSSCTSVAAAGATGKIGSALVLDLLNYAQSKGLKVLLGVSWWHFSGYGGCGAGSYAKDLWFPLYMYHTGQCSGTDPTYGIVEDPDFLVPKMWLATPMNRYINTLSAVCDYADSHAALEGIVMLTEEGDLPVTAALTAAGYTIAGFSAQLARIQAAVKPHCPHTSIFLAYEWSDPVTDFANMLLSGYNDPSKAMGYYQNDFWPAYATSGTAAFIGYTSSCGGGGNPCWGNTSTHDFRGQLPVVAKITDELCSGVSQGKNYGPYTPSQFWDAAFTSGSASMLVPMKPTHMVVDRMTGINYCPGNATQQWGTSTSGGWKQWLLEHPWPAAAAACPTSSTGGCNTAP